MIMDLEEKVFKEILDDQGYTNKFKHLMTDLYMRAYHDGRHAERDRLVKGGYLIINPEKFNELDNKCQDPCDGCEFKSDYLKIGCSNNPKECQKKQEQLRVMEIMTWFKMKK